MLRLSHAVLCVFALLPMIAVAAGPDAEAVPDEGATRKHIDALISSAGKNPITLGLVQQTIDLSISFGAPSFNAGDRAGCARFYMKTAESLAAAFPADHPATESARHALNDLKAAFDRAKRAADDEGRAWAMRFAFDKTQLATLMQATRTDGLIDLGNEYLKRGQSDEAVDAYQTAVASLHELDGEPVAIIPISCRYAPLGAGNALFVQKKYKEASDSILAGLAYIPQWPAVKQDLRSLYRDPADYESVMEDLQAQSRQSPDDAALHFLLGYQYHFTGKKSAAKEQFQRVLELDSKHAGAKIFLNPVDPKLLEEVQSESEPAPKLAKHPKGSGL